MYIDPSSAKSSLTTQDLTTLHPGHPHERSPVLAWEGLKVAAPGDT